MFVVDTNVLLYAAEKSFTEHKRCHQLVEDWRRQPMAWYTTWGILYEFVRVATHPRVFRKPWTPAGAWAFVETLLQAPSLTVLVEGERHRATATQVLKEVPFVAGNLIHDAHTAILMREHGIRRIYTRDMDFHRFPFLEVRDPLATPA